MTEAAVAGGSGVLMRTVQARLNGAGYGVRLGQNAQALEGAETLIYLVTPFNREPATEAGIVAEAESMIGGARVAGIKRIVCVSCMGADAAAESPLYRAAWRAERVVISSGIPYAVLRLGVLLGRDDGILAPLAGLMRVLPAVPVPGKGTVRSQPIGVEDAGRCVEAALGDGQMNDAVIEAGGPMFLTFRQMADLVGGAVGVARPKVLVPERALGMATRFIPPEARDLYAGPRLEQFRRGVVASPGSVRTAFGFEPASPVDVIRESVA